MSALSPEMPFRSASVEGTIDELLGAPQLDDGSLARLLGRLHPGGATAALLRRLEGGALPLQQVLAFVAALSKLAELGAHGAADSLWRAAVDAERRIEERAAAAGALAAVAPEFFAPHRAAAPEELDTLAQSAAAYLVLMLEVDGCGEADWGRLGDWSAGGADWLLGQLESARQALGAPALPVYRAAFAGAASPQVRRSMLQVIAAQAGADASATLQHFRDVAPDPEARRACQRALLDHHTARVASGGGDVAAPNEWAGAGAAFVTACDGRGVFVVLGAFERTEGAYALVEMALTVQGRVLHAAVAPAAHESALHDRLDELEESTGCAAVPAGVAEAAELVVGAGNSAQSPAEVESAKAWFRLGACLPLSRPRSVAPAEQITAAVLLRLFEEARWAGTWRFSPADLSEAGVRVGEDEARALASLDTPAMRSQLASMAHHMGRWHELSDSPVQAAYFRAAAAQVELGLPQSALAQSLWRRTPVDFP